MPNSVCLLCVMVVAGLLLATAQSNGSCSVCNCQLKSAENLIGFIDNRVQTIVQNTLNAVLAAQPIIAMSYIFVSPSMARIQSLNGTTFSRVGTTSEIRFNSYTSSTSSDNIIAYRPNYRDRDGSNLAAVFVNLETLYPCISGLGNSLVCQAFANGLTGGRSLIQGAESGDHFRIFSSPSNSPVATWAFGLSDCTRFNTNCLSNMGLELTLVCLLPRELCML